MSRTWLVTGASRGFGRSLTEAVLAAGDSVLATARRPEQLADLVARYGERVRPVALDVTDADAAVRAVKEATSGFGRLDVVVNNAGYANSAPIEEMAEDDFRTQLETNLFGVVNVTRAALPVFRAQRSGTFVQFSSIGGRVGGTPGMGAYQTAKFAVEGFSEVLASEVAPFGVQVIIVEPGAFRTDWQGASMTRHAVGPTTKRRLVPSTATGTSTTATSRATRYAARRPSSTSSARTTRRGGSSSVATPSWPRGRPPRSERPRPSSGPK